MYESVEVGGLTPTPNPFLVVDFYNQNRACLLPEKGLPAPGPYSTPLRTPLWNGSNHCRYRPPLSCCGSWGWGWAVGLPLLPWDAGLGAWRGSCLYPSLSLVYLAETRVPLLDNWTAPSNPGRCLCYIRTEELWGFLPSGNICSPLLLRLAGEMKPFASSLYLRAWYPVVSQERGPFCHPGG